MKFPRAIIFTLALSLTATAQAEPVPASIPTPATPVAGPAPTPPAPEFQAKSWLLVDFTSGQVLTEKNADERVEPASLTKVMTSYVISSELKAGKIKAEDPVLVSEHAWRGGGAGTDGSTSFLPVNQTVPLKDLLAGMIVQSGNDASIALAEHAAGSEDIFAQLMNQYAAKLGLRDTHYVNAHGLTHADHYTTARDVALLSRALINDFPEDYALYALKEFEFNGIKQTNRNTLLWRDPTVDGIKTGHHSGAGYCLAASAKRDDMRLIAVIMGASSERARADAAQALLNYGFRFFESHKLYAAGQPLAERILWKGEVEQIALGLSNDALITIPRGRYGELKASMDLPTLLTAPFSKGQEVGRVRITLDDKTLLERPLVALADYPEGGFFKRLSDSVLLWFEDDEPAPSP